MSAKEMFEELGYKHEHKLQNLIEYYTETRDLGKEKRWEKISFDLSNKTYYKSYEKGIAGYITIWEQQAINKQIEELGWERE